MKCLEFLFLPSKHNYNIRKETCYLLRQMIIKLHKYWLHISCKLMDETELWKNSIIV